MTERTDEENPWAGLLGRPAGTTKWVPGVPQVKNQCFGKMVKGAMIKWITSVGGNCEASKKIVWTSKVHL